MLFQQNARSIIGSMSKLVDIAGKIPMEKPSKGYSRFMKSMHNLFKDRAGYATIFHCIGFDFFSDEDCIILLDMNLRKLQEIVENRETWHAGKSMGSQRVRHDLAVEQP